MMKFFRGWRRKIGLVTLGLVCVFKAAWVRSLSRYDAIGISRQGDYQYLLESGTGKLFCTDINKIVAGPFNPDPSFVSWWTSAASDSCFDDYPEMVHVYWGWKGFGLIAWSSGSIHAKTTELAVPYWSIVFPLILISLWLLLKKPKTSTLTELANPSETKAEGQHAGDFAKSIVLLKEK